MGDHSGPYQSQDPNKTDEQMMAEALQCAWLLRNHRTVADVARITGLSHMTVNRRLEMLTLRIGGPPRSLMRMVEDAKLTDLEGAVAQALWGLSGTDAELLRGDVDRRLAEGIKPEQVAALVRAAASVHAARAQLWALGVDRAAPEDNGADDVEPPEWVLAEEQAAEERGRAITSGEE